MRKGQAHTGLERSYSANFLQGTTQCLPRSGLVHRPKAGFNEIGLIVRFSSLILKNSKIVNRSPGKVFAIESIGDQEPSTQALVVCF